jgi:hypothetical protein
MRLLLEGLFMRKIISAFIFLTLFLGFRTIPVFAGKQEDLLAWREQSIRQCLFQGKLHPWEPLKNDRYFIQLKGCKFRVEAPFYEDFIKKYFPNRENEISIGPVYGSQQSERKIFVSKAFFEDFIRPEIEFFKDIKASAALDAILGSDLSDWVVERSKSEVHYSTYVEESIYLTTNDQLAEWGIFDMRRISEFPLVNFRFTKEVFENEVKPAMVKYAQGASERAGIEKALLQRFIDLVRKGPHYAGKAPLQVAIEESLPYIAKLLILNNEVDVKATMPDGTPWTHFALKASQPYLVFLMLRQGANPNIQDSDGNTLLHIAAQTQLKYIVFYIEAILAFSADPRIQNKLGNTAYHVTAAARNVEIYNVLNRATPDPMFRNHEQKTSHEVYREEIAKSEQAQTEWKKKNEKEIEQKTREGLERLEKTISDILDLGKRQPKIANSIQTFIQTEVRDSKLDSEQLLRKVKRQFFEKKWLVEGLSVGEQAEWDTVQKFFLDFTRQEDDEKRRVLVWAAENQDEDWLLGLEKEIGMSRTWSKYNDALQRAMIPVRVELTQLETLIRKMESAGHLAQPYVDRYLKQLDEVMVPMTPLQMYFETVILNPKNLGLMMAELRNENTSIRLQIEQTLEEVKSGKLKMRREIFQKLQKLLADAGSAQKLDAIENQLTRLTSGYYNAVAESALTWNSESKRLNDAVIRSQAWMRRVLSEKAALRKISNPEASLLAKKIKARQSSRLAQLEDVKEAR